MFSLKPGLNSDHRMKCDESDKKEILGWNNGYDALKEFKRMRLTNESWYLLKLV